VWVGSLRLSGDLCLNPVMLRRFIARFLLLLIIVAGAGIYLMPQWQSWRVEQQFSDRLLRIAPDAAIQAGFVETMHEQRWSSAAFFHLFGLTLPRGRTESVVRAPVRVYYGVRPQAVHVLSFEDGVMTVAVDRVEVLNTATDLSGLQIETEVGWARFDALSGEEARAAARRAFDRTRVQAAGKLLAGRDVSEHVRRALEEVATAIGGVKHLRLVRRDQPRQGQ